MEDFSVKEAKDSSGVHELSLRPAQAHGSLSQDELSVAVAEGVMGYVRSPLKSIHSQEWFYLTPDGRRLYPQSLTFSSSIVAAMGVVEKMVALGWWVGIGQDDEISDKKWYAEFYRRGVERRGWAESTRLPEAICRAALQTLAS